MRPTVLARLLQVVVKIGRKVRHDEDFDMKRDVFSGNYVKDPKEGNGSELLDR